MLEEHISGLGEIFRRLRKVNLKLKPQKCNFFQRHVKFLGHIISSEGLQPEEDKVRAIANYPPPTNVQELQSFLGLVGYYWKFIPDFAEITSCLTQLIKKDTSLYWSEDRQ